MGSAPCRLECCSCRARGCRCEHPLSSKAGRGSRGRPSSAQDRDKLHSTLVEVNTVFLPSSQELVWGHSVPVLLPVSPIFPSDLVPMEKRFKTMGRKFGASGTEMGWR